MIITELYSNSLPWAWPHFRGASRAVTYVDRPSVVFDTANSLPFYGYSGAIAYTTYPITILPDTCQILLKYAKGVGVECNSIHMLLYRNESVQFGWHNDLPLAKNSHFMIFRLGYPRDVVFENMKHPLRIGEGDAYIV